MRAKYLGWSRCCDISGRNHPPIDGSVQPLADVVDPEELIQFRTVRQALKIVRQNSTQMNSYQYDQGAWGEALAAYQLSTILNAEACKETMRGEGMGALDLQVKVPVTYPTKTHHQLAVQVKTGTSFAIWTPTKNRWRIDNVASEHIAKWRATNQPVLFLWVRIEPIVRVYWKLITSRTPLTTLSFSDAHSLDPAARFEIERLLHMHRMHVASLPKITTHTLKSTAEVRKWAESRFRKELGSHKCPLGDVTISNYAWRHLTRVTRPQSHIIDSLTTLPYVRRFLDLRPHQIQTISQERSATKNSVTITRKVLAIYRDIRFDDKGTCAVYVRLDERIVYPKNWEARGLLREGVSQELTLESIYRKPT